MREIFRFCFEQLTDPLTLPLNPLAEWIILAVLHELVYLVAFSKVGDLYHSGIISGRLSGSLIHWVIRLIMFIVSWAGINAVIAVYMFLEKHWRMIIGIIGGTLFLAGVGVMVSRSMLRYRSNKTPGNNP